MKRTTQGRLTTTVLALFLIGAGLAALIWGGLSLQRDKPTPTVQPSPTWHERLIPTATPATQSPVQATKLATSTPRSSPTPLPPTATPTPAPTTTPSPPDSLPTTPPPEPTPTPTLQVGLALFAPRQRIGIVAPRSDVEQYDVGRLGAGWYLQSRTDPAPPRPAGMEAVLFVGVSGGAFSPEAATLQEIARANPGTLWLVGNEPDVIWQSNATPTQYASAYHDAYELLKAADPTCQVAIGAIAQVTPLRLRYLEAILDAYQAAYGQPMPVDVWNIHLAILREERGTWGVDIPPGLPDDRGILYEIGDNARVDLLQEQVWTFRRWMDARGERDKPLIVTEFSVLMPPEYGFPFDTVRAFMVDAFDFLLTARDEQIGYPADGHRLVQRCAWYSLADTVYFTGNLFDPDSSQITPLGRAFAEYVTGLTP